MKYHFIYLTMLFVFLSGIGRSYCVRTQRMLNQCLESLVQKVQSGVVINFEKTGPDPLPVGEGTVDNLLMLKYCIE
jgi:hypothetical protein